MNIRNLAARHMPELARRLRDHQYESGPHGLLVPKMGLRIGGVFRSRVNGRDEQISENLFTAQGLNYILDVALSAGAAITAFYLAPFSGDTTPLDTWTGANFTASATEFTGYTGSRPAWQEGGPVAKEISNEGNEAVFVLTANGTLRGVGALSASTKSATTGICLAASRFGADRALIIGDELALGYDVVAADGT